MFFTADYDQGFSGMTDSLSTGIEHSTHFRSYRQLRSFLLLVIATFTALVGPPSQQASADVHIKWECRDDKKDAGCIASGGLKYIYIYGEIDGETADGVARINGALPLDTPFPIVYLNSYGGHVSSAFKIGRILRQRSASVESKDVFFPNRMASCNSACAIIAMGATTRNLLQVGIHQGGLYGSRKGRAVLESESDETSLKTYWRYMDEMGMPPSLKVILQKTPHSRIAEFLFDLNDPFSEQDIVKYGFRMRQPVDDELAKIRNLVLHLNEGLAGLRKMAEEGDSRSAYKLGHVLFFGDKGEKQDVAEGLNWLNRAGDAGDVVALHLLGVIYANGYEGVRKDEARAVRYYVRAAKLGSAGSQNNLAWNYYKGHGVKKNVAEAIFWATRSAEQGEPFAYGSLGTMRFEGNGFIRDDVETYKWLKLATTLMPEGNARDGDSKTLEQLKRRMTPAQMAEGDKLAKEWRPLKQTARVMNDKD